MTRNPDSRLRIRPAARRARIEREPRIESRESYFSTRDSRETALVASRLETCGCASIRSETAVLRAATKRFLRNQRTATIRNADSRLRTHPTAGMAGARIAGNAPIFEPRTEKHDSATFDSRLFFDSRFAASHPSPPRGSRETGLVASRKLEIGDSA